ncbi:MAG TPA: phospholipid carrier-dependent glycosyltransferase, partial [Planctomycetia bacterium]|nr:phospholipid carrier-dependent glycosyltransferase [Planctomycetia bacterium]
MNRTAGDDRRTAVTLFLCLFAFYALFRHDRDWNTASRLLLTYSLAETGSIEITPYVVRQDRLLRDPFTWDMASPDKRRFYCDKAPAQSFLGAALVAPLAKAGLWSLHGKANDATIPRPEAYMRWPGDYAVTLFGSALFAAGAAALVFLFLRAHDADPVAAAGSALLLGFASPFLPYATLFYGHVAAGFWTTLALYLTWRPAQPGRAASFAGGLAAGLATATEYTLAVHAAAFVICGFAFVPFRRNIAAGLCFLAGGAMIAMALGGYHQAINGSPWTPAYRYEVLAQFQ